MSDPITPEAPTSEPATKEPAANPTSTFTQEQVNALLAEQKRKVSERFTGFDDLKAKAEQFDAAQEAAKTEQQRAAEAALRAERERDEARAESLRYKAAATHGVGADDFDLLGSGDEATITARAERVGNLVRENAQLKAELEALRAGKPAPVNGRPTEQLKPGATPEQVKTEDDVLYERLYGAS